MPDSSKDKEYKIKKTIGLLLELADAADSASKSISDSTTNIKRKLESLGLTKPLNSKAAILEELKVQEFRLQTEQEIIKLREEEIKKEKQLKEEKQKTAEIEKKREQALKEAKKKYEAKIDKDITRFNDFYNKATGSNFSLSNLGNYKYGEALNKADEIRDRVKNQVSRDYARRGIADSAHYTKMLQEIDIKTNEAIKASGLGQSSESLQIAAGLLNSAGKLLTTFAKSALAILKDGINRQTQIYENTFHDVSARTGISRGEYKQFQRNTNSRLKSMGLNGSVSVSENQEMLAKLVDLGMSQDTAIASALDNVITNKIVPYLDTTSRDFNLINNRLDNKFVKDIRGINAYNADIVGNNYLTSDLLNKIIDMVQPMSDEALQNLAQSSGNFTAAMNYLMSAEGGNLSYDQAMDYWNQIYKQQNYANQIMRNGTVAERLTQIGYLENNVDLENPNNLNRALGVLIDSQSSAYIGPGYGTGSQLNNLIQSAVGDALGFSRSQGLALEKLRKAGVTGSTLMGLSEFDLSKYSQGEFTRLQNNETYTAKEIEKFWIENKGTTLATINESLGQISRDIVTAIGGIATAAIGGKLASMIAKGFWTAGGSTGVSGSIGAIGGTALGTLMAVTAPVAIAAGIGKLSDYFDKKDVNKEAEAWSMEHYGEPGADNAVYSELMGNVAHVKNNTKKGGTVGSAFKLMWDYTVGRIRRSYTRY